MTAAAYFYICDGDIDNPVLTHKKMDWPEKYPHWQEIPLVMAQPEQELVCVCGAVWEGEELVSIPPQRTWVGLTDDEIDQGLLRSDYAFKTAEAWRAGVVFAMTKLKEKNHG